MSWWNTDVDLVLRSKDCVDLSWLLESGEIDGGLAFIEKGWEEFTAVKKKRPIFH
jgi:hypothetical protein